MTTTDTPVVTRPKTVTVAHWLYIVGAVLGVIGAVVLLVTLPAALDLASHEAARVAQGQNTNGVDVSAVTKGAVIGGDVLSAVMTLAFSILTVVFARKMLAAKNWARVVLAVFAVFAGLQIFGVAGSYGVGALHFVVVLAALILSFLPASNAWFRAAKATRTTA